MPGAHRDRDRRFCGAKTIVTGQSSVLVNNKLWAVEGDRDTNNTNDNPGVDNCPWGKTDDPERNASLQWFVKGSDYTKIAGIFPQLKNSTSTIKMTGDDKCGVTGATNPLGHSNDVLVYGGQAGGGKSVGTLMRS